MRREERATETRPSAPLLKGADNFRHWSRSAKPSRSEFAKKGLLLILERRKCGRSSPTPFLLLSSSRPLVAHISNLWIPSKYNVITTWIVHVEHRLQQTLEWNKGNVLLPFSSQCTRPFVQLATCSGPSSRRRGLSEACDQNRLPTAMEVRDWPGLADSSGMM